MPLPLALRQVPFALRPGLACRAASVLAVAACLLPAAGPANAHAETTPAPAGCTGPASGTWLKVVVEGIRNANGQVAVTIYADDSSRFLARGGSLYTGRVKAIAGTTPVCIFVPRPGVYAIATYHDENGDGHFNRTGIGLPAEGYGFSNNASTLMGLPSFDSVRLSVTRSGLTSHIRLKYP